MFYPLFIDLTDAPVLIIGGGEIAYRKGKNLRDTGAKITLIAPKRIKEWDELNIAWLEAPYDSQDLTRYHLVIAATNNEALNASIIKKCKEENILCNSASKGTDGNVIFPGVINEGGFTLAITSQGRTPFLTKKIKKDVTNVVSQYTEDLITLLSETRAYIIKEFPEEKEVLLRKLSNASMKTIGEKGNIHDITNWLQRE